MKDKAKKKYNIDDTPFVAEIRQIKSMLKMQLVSRTEFEPLWDQLVSDYHYLGHGKTIGPRVKYIIWLNGRPLSAISFNQAVKNLASHLLALSIRRLNALGPLNNASMK